MSEFIVNTFGIVQDFADLHVDMNTPLYRKIMCVMMSRQREQIVRCRDCKWCMAYNNATYCDRFAHALPTVELDGFCAWAVRRTEAESG